MTRYFLGIDVGTTGTKTYLMSDDGLVVKTSYKPYGLVTGDNNVVEQNAEDWWDACCFTVSDCVSALPQGARVESISMSTQGGSLVAVDKNGNPLALAISWMDGRCKKQSKWVNSLLSAKTIFNKIGWGCGNGNALLDILWYKENAPDIYENAALFLTTHDYVSLKMTGIPAIDPSNAAMTMLFNVTAQDWDDDFVRIAGITKSRLAKVIPSGEIIGNLTKEAADALGLDTDVLLISGGHDQYCGALGSGLVMPGELVVSTGTSWVMTAITNGPLFDSESCFHPGKHVVPGKWGIITSISTGGVSLEWFKKIGFSGASDEEKKGALRRLDEEAAKIAPGCNGAMFFPYFNGSIVPTRNEAYKGTFLGLTLNHTIYDMGKAIMEGLAFEMRNVINELEQKGHEIHSVTLTGGATKSPIWKDIFVNILNKPVILPLNADAPCIGAGLLGAVTVGIFSNHAAATDAFKSGTMLLPDKKLAATYNELFLQYKARSAALKVLYK